MQVVEHHDYATLRATGAEVDALYRIYLAEFGRNDWATRTVLEAAANRREHSEDIDGVDAVTVGNALAAHGLIHTARQLWAVGASMRAEELRDEADALERQAAGLEAAVWNRT